MSRTKGTTKRRYDTDFENGKHEKSKQVERTIKCLFLLGKGGIESEKLAASLGISERTLRRFMGAMSRAGVKVFTTHEPQQQKTLWAMDVDKFLEKFKKGG